MPLYDSNAINSRLLERTRRMTNLTPEALHLKQIADRAGWEALAEHVRRAVAEAREAEARRVIDATLDELAAP